MYNDTLKVANKIIKSEDLFEIFEKMNNDLEYYKRQYHQEELKNQNLKYSEQEWNFKHFIGKLKFNVNFYDDTSITFDNYANFMSIFNNRLGEIKSIYVTYGLIYTTSKPGISTRQVENYSHHIYMYIYENKASIDVSLNSNDNKMEEVFKLIKEKILNAPEKYDRVVKKKKAIVYKVGFAIGLIPAIILASLSLLIPELREVYSSSYILYPIICLFLGFVIGGSICTGGISKLYETISPDKKYVGYDYNKHKNVYKDDIDSYISKSEILIGKNVDNMNKRKEIEEKERIYSKFIPLEILIILLLSVIVILL